MLRAWIEKERQAELHRRVTGFGKITYLLPSYIAVSTMLVRPIARQRLKKIGRKKNKFRMPNPEIGKNLGLANAWCQSRIKIGQNGWIKIVKFERFWIRYLGVLSGVLTDPNEIIENSSYK
jgi:hypothetical protein